MPVCKMIVDQMTVCKVIVYKMTVEKCHQPRYCRPNDYLLEIYRTNSVDKVLVDKMAVEEMS